MQPTPTPTYRAVWMPRLLWVSAAAALFVATTALDAVIGDTDDCRAAGLDQAFGSALCHPAMRFLAWLVVASFAFWIVAGLGTLVLGGLDAISAAARRLGRTSH